MNASNIKRSVNSNLLKCTVLAMALGMPGWAFAGGSDEHVAVRSDTKLEQKSGRDSVYALSPEPTYAAAQVEPQRYGRAGGFAGSDRVNMMPSQSSDSVARVGTPGSQTSQMSDEGRTSGGRFDNPDSAHGQDEAGIQTR